MPHHNAFALVLFAAASCCAPAALSAQPPTAVLPSDRLLTPVGQLAQTPNFPTQLALGKGHVSVLAGGANKRQGIQRFSVASLQAQGGVLTLFSKDKKHAAPGATVAQGRRGDSGGNAGEQAIKGQSLFQGLATGPDGTLYATGGNSDDLLALGASSDGALHLLRRSAPQVAIWDDHDYGPNDSDASFEFKNASLDLFKTYWANPTYGVGVGDVAGVFTKTSIADVDIFLLDDRWWRSADATSPGDRGKVLFGPAQMRWLKNALLFSRARFTVVLARAFQNRRRGWPVIQ
jgi:hypothetical protein